MKHIKSPAPKFSDDEIKKYFPSELLESFPEKNRTEQLNGIIESVWGGTVEFDVDENFANVIGSTDDPKIKNESWIGLWRSKFGEVSECTSLNTRKFECNDILVGGHIIGGTEAEEVAHGSNKVYIMPICSRHNGNDKVYMSAKTNQEGIWLKDYFGKSLIDCLK
jgi:hypothetical protein